MLMMAVQECRKSLFPIGPFKQMNEMPATPVSDLLDVKEKNKPHGLLQVELSATCRPHRF